MKFDFSTKAGTDRYYAHQRRRAFVNSIIFTGIALVIYLVLIFKKVL